MLAKFTSTFTAPLTSRPLFSVIIMFYNPSSPVVLLWYSWLQGYPLEYGQWSRAYNLRESFYLLCPEDINCQWFLSLEWWFVNATFPCFNLLVWFLCWQRQIRWGHDFRSPLMSKRQCFAVALPDQCLLNSFHHSSEMVAKPWKKWNLTDIQFVTESSKDIYILIFAIHVLFDSL